LKQNVQIDLVRGMMDCLYAECKPCITDCVMAELEKLGQKYRVALKVREGGQGQRLEYEQDGKEEMEDELSPFLPLRPFLISLPLPHTWAHACRSPRIPG
jgi:hypothetical protein